MERDCDRDSGRAPAEAERDDDGGDDDGSGDGSHGGEADAVAPPHRQVRDLDRAAVSAGAGWPGGAGGLGLFLDRGPELGNRLDLGLRPGLRLAPGNWVEPGGGPVLGIGRAISLCLLLGQGGDQSGDRPVFEVGWRLDVGRKEIDDRADLAVLVDNALAVNGSRLEARSLVRSAGHRSPRSGARIYAVGNATEWFARIRSSGSHLRLTSARRRQVSAGMIASTSQGRSA